MAVTVKPQDILQGMEFQTDEGSSHLNTTTGEATNDLVDDMHEVPVLMIPCVEAQMVSVSTGAYGSIFPATWPLTLMLALRARDLGSAWASPYLRYEKEATT